MCKRFIAILLILIMVFATLPVTASAHHAKDNNYLAEYYNAEYWFLVNDQFIVHYNEELSLAVIISPYCLCDLFAGEYYNSATCKGYLRARTYNPRLGRFTSPDIHWSIHANNMQFGDSPTMRNGRLMPYSPATLQAGNLYMYTMHNPVMFIDPSGNTALKAAIAAALVRIFSGGNTSSGQRPPANAAQPMRPPANAAQPAPARPPTTQTGPNASISRPPANAPANSTVTGNPVPTVSTTVTTTSTTANVQQNIVGTNFNSVRPTQDWINMNQVNSYAARLRAGETVAAIEAVNVSGRGTYILDGHHRFVASQITGISVDISITVGQGPVGLPNWSSVTPTN